MMYLNNYNISNKQKYLGKDSGCIIDSVIVKNLMLNVQSIIPQLV